MAESEVEPSDFTPLTPEQAQALREKSPSISPWRVLAVQCVAGVLVTLLAWAVSEQAVVAWSAAFGALAVVIPGALFARGLTGQFASVNVGSAVMSFFVWEFIKIVVTVAVMYTASRVVNELSWPALLISLVVTMKVYWLALRFGRKRPPLQNVTLNGKSN